MPSITHQGLIFSSSNQIAPVTESRATLFDQEVCLKELDNYAIKIILNGNYNYRKNLSDKVLMLNQLLKKLFSKLLNFPYLITIQNPSKNTIEVNGLPIELNVDQRFQFFSKLISVNYDDDLINLDKQIKNILDEFNLQSSLRSTMG